LFEEITLSIRGGFCPGDNVLDSMMVSFWFYRADRQRDRQKHRITNTDDHCTHATTVGVSNNLEKVCA